MFDLEALSDAIEAYGRVVRVVIAEARGSTPREAGTEMLIWGDGTRGTIGGGQLEWDACARAREMLEDGPDTRVTRQALGPALHQCCGGAVTLVSELFDAARYRALGQAFEFQGTWARAVEAGAGSLPDTARRKIEKLQYGDTPMPTLLTGGWLVEPVWRARQPVYIYGAGHVGRALAQVLAELPQFEVWLSDVREVQFDGLADSIRQSWQVPPTEIMEGAPDDAVHLIMTPDHDYDLELCHQLLRREFSFAGLIGSETKWARFRSRLARLGHAEDQIARIVCPIGDPALGKHPQAIAVSVTAGLLNLRADARPAREISA